MIYDVALSTFVALFVIIDPIGNVPIFMALTKGTDIAHQRVMAIKGTIMAFVVLSFFAWFGADFLNLLGIGLPAFRIAGGLMLGIIAFEMVFEKRNPRKSKAAEEINKVIAPDDISVFPLAIPLMAGPGSIASVMLLMSQHEGDHVLQLTVNAVLGGVILLSMILFLMIGPIGKLMTESAVSVLSRLLGIILAALSVQFVVDGLKASFGI